MNLQSTRNALNAKSLPPMCLALLSKPLVERHHPVARAGTTDKGKSVSKEMVHDMEELKEPAMT